MRSPTSKSLSSNSSLIVFSSSLASFPLNACRATSHISTVKKKKNITLSRGGDELAHHSGVGGGPGDGKTLEQWTFSGNLSSIAIALAFGSRMIPFHCKSGPELFHEITPGLFT